MTVGRFFDFNPDLATVSNIHTAQRVFDCETGINTGTWTATLSGGLVVHGTGSTWPVVDQPAAMKILQYSTSGQGQVVEDKTSMILAALSSMATSGSGGSGAAGTGSGGQSGGTGG